MFATIAPRYDRANHVLSLRFDVGWRKRVARQILPRPGGVILDLASGTGDLTADLIRFGKHRPVAADFTFEMLVAGRSKLDQFVPRPPQISADALSLPFRGDSFDAVTVAFGIRNFADPLAGLREMFRVLRPGGGAGILEFSRPARPIDAFYRIYLNRLLPAIGGWITGRREAYQYLPASVGEFPQGERFLALMRQAGFSNNTAARLSGGIVTFYRGEKP